VSPRRRKQVDPLEQAMETALAPGSFISYKAAWSFVDDVHSVANDVEKLIEGEPERAGRLTSVRRSSSGWRRRRSIGS